MMTKKGNILKKYKTHLDYHLKNQCLGSMMTLKEKLGQRLEVGLMEVVVTRSHQLDFRIVYFRKMLVVGPFCELHQNLAMIWNLHQ